MKTIIHEGVTYEHPDLAVISSSPVMMQIAEGEYTGFVFMISNINTDNAVDEQINYDLDFFAPVNREFDNEQMTGTLKGYADNFLLISLIEHMREEDEITGS